MFTHKRPYFPPINHRYADNRFLPRPVGQTKRPVFHPRKAYPAPPPSPFDLHGIRRADLRQNENAARATPLPMPSPRRRYRPRSEATDYPTAEEFKKMHYLAPPPRRANAPPRLVGAQVYVDHDDAAQPLVKQLQAAGPLDEADQIMLQRLGELRVSAMMRENYHKEAVVVEHAIAEAPQRERHLRLRAAAAAKRRKLQEEREREERRRREEQRERKEERERERRRIAAQIERMERERIQRQREEANRRALEEKQRLEERRRLQAEAEERRRQKAEEAARAAHLESIREMHRQRMREIEEQRKQDAETRARWEALVREREAEMRAMEARKAEEAARRAKEEEVRRAQEEAQARRAQEEAQARHAQEEARRAQEEARRAQEEARRAQEEAQQRAREEQARASQAEFEVQARRVCELYELKWAELKRNSALKNTVAFHEFPFPVFAFHHNDPAEMTYERVREFLFHSFRSTAAGKSKKEVLKMEVLRWHPDKFDSLIGPKMRQDEWAKTKEAAGLVARWVTRLMAEV